MREINLDGELNDEKENTKYGPKNKCIGLLNFIIY